MSDPAWGSATKHQRYPLRFVPGPHGLGRRRCSCGCGQWATHKGVANGVALILGCELVVRRWVRDGARMHRSDQP